MQEFNTLHQQNTPLLLANVWDVSSAKCAELAGYQAIGTSSAAIAEVLGYKDGEQIPFNELLFMVRRITASTSLPCSVDIEGGYSRDADVIVQHIKQLAQVGVVGINIEDSIVDKTRVLREAETFARLIANIKKQLQAQQVGVFINVRCDVFLLGLVNAGEEAISRAHRYQNAGADGLFFPCITRDQDIRAVVEATTLPVNVMAMPDLANFSQLTRLGVKRISTGNVAHSYIYQQLSKLLVNIKKKASCQLLFS